MSKDRRIFERIGGIVNVRYAVKGRDKEKIESLPRNIGGGGVGLCLAERLQPGALLELEITIPDNPQKAILGVGEVSWSKPYGFIEADQKVKLHDHGVKFIDIDPISIGRVYTYHRSLSPK